MLATRHSSRFQEVLEGFTYATSILTLLTEVRNRVYELAVQDANAWQYEYFPNCLDDSRDDLIFAYHKSMLPRLVSPARNKYRGSRFLPGKVGDWDQLSRKYLGLTQACSQI